MPQESVLGPLSFLVYINEIAKQLLSLTRLFADDISLLYAAANIADIAGIINNDLHLAFRWRADEFGLSSFVIFQAIWTSIC